MKRLYTLRHSCLHETPEAKPANPASWPEVSPSDSVIRNILNYSRALSVLRTSSQGTICLVMN